ncbi:CRISPR-associated helicase Cas3' [Kurthia sibirica]|nr:CRISPR-associated helicase Cas3' [Kurthia sibirica]GEK35337.1 CRISPR-associated helicase/endonuclease Cas3 [Kurthia sibirica]
MFYAKSKPEVLSIVEHTEDVVQAIQVLKDVTSNFLPLNEKDWELLKLAALFHDTGKYSEGFQNRISQSIDKAKRKPDGLINYPHNYLSLLFIPFDKLRADGYTKKDLILLALAVGFHHEREKLPNKSNIMAVYKKQIYPNYEEIKKDFSNLLSEKPNESMVTHLEKRTLIYRQLNSELKKKYTLIKGLLQRADRSASAKLRHENIKEFVEKAVDSNVGYQTEQFLKKNFTNLRPLQQLALDNQRKNIVLIAQTGSGKTEASLLWIGQRKGFITLPLRVSLNAMYDRIIDTNGINYSHVGLLHSSAIDHLMLQKKDENDKTSFEETLLQIGHTQRLAEKLTFSTIDQLFKFPLLYRGFEIELSTLAYSKVVIDEIQAYDPKIVAILLQGLKMIDDIGGSWMIMTATLPAIFIEELNRLGLLTENTLQQTLLLADDRSEDVEVPRRHRISLEKKTLNALTEDMIEKSKDSKVLVVVNTVKQALSLYDSLKSIMGESVNLLHSQFIPLHRGKKETEILKFAQLTNEDNGLWICTQIVEASLDVDFDYLYTEAATPDALFQRFGRCNRKGKRFDGGTPNSPNIFIVTDLDGISGMDTVYEKKIVENGLRLLKALRGSLIDEEQKIRIVHEVFSREFLAGTDYLKVFEETIKDLKELPPFELDSAGAQHVLRDIKSVPLVAGQENYEKVLILIEKYEEEKRKKNYAVLKQLNIEIQQYLLSVNQYRLNYQQEKEQFKLSKFSQIDFSYVYFSTDVFYTEERGLDLKLDENISNIF